MFYTYSQNNSGGSFVFRRGISVFVIVEADSAAEANVRAEQIGLYFGGEGDCECCGDRWYPYSSTAKGDKWPSLHGKRVTTKATAETLSLFIKWAKGPEVFIHYKDGRVVPAVRQ